MFQARKRLQALRRRHSRAEASRLLEELAAGVWPQKRRFDLGLTTKTSTCPNCQAPAEDMWHVSWVCPSNTAHEDFTAHG